MSETNRGRIPEGDERYHNTWLLLSKYRDVMWSMEVSVSQAQLVFHREYGQSVEEFLDSVYCAGIDLEDTQLQDRALRIKQSKDMLDLVRTAVETMKAKHRRGEEYYWILYYTYMIPQEYDNVEEILEQLRPHIRDISHRTYYRKRREAIEILSSLLWGYSNEDTMGLLNTFLDEKQAEP